MLNSHSYLSFFPAFSMTSLMAVHQLVPIPMLNHLFLFSNDPYLFIVLQLPFFLLQVIPVVFKECERNGFKQHGHGGEVDLAKIVFLWTLKILGASLCMAMLSLAFFCFSHLLTEIKSFHALLSGGIHLPPAKEIKIQECGWLSVHSKGRIWIPQTLQYFISTVSSVLFICYHVFSKNPYLEALLTKNLWITIIFFM